MSCGCKEAGECKKQEGFVPMNIALGSDHAGFGMKEELKAWLVSLGHHVYDCGAPSAERVDYPDYAFKACNCLAERTEAKAKAADPATKNFPVCERVVLVCGTGIGISISANKLRGVRCALCHDHFTAEMCRRHNNANAVAVGARVIGIEVAKEIVSTFLTTPFDGMQHTHRVELMMALEGK